MATQTIESTLFTSIHPDVAKRISISGILLSTAMLLAGILLFVSLLGVHDKSSSVSMALMVAGISLVLFGIFRLFWKAKELVYLPTGSVAKERSLYFDLKYLQRLTDMLERGAMDDSWNVKSNSSGIVRLDIMLSQDNRFAALQLFQFIPYAYSPVTSVYYFTGGDAAAIAAFLQKCL